MEHYDYADEQMKRERKQFEELLKYMEECHDKMDDDADAVYGAEVVIGFGGRFARSTGSAATFTALQDAINYILEEDYEEYAEPKPIGRIVKSYEIDYTGGGIYVVVGQLVSGEFFSGQTPDDGECGLALYEAEDEAREALADDTIAGIAANSAKYVLLWNEIIDDYVQKHGASEMTENWKKGLYEEV